MKEKLSISIEKEKIARIEEHIKSGEFRSKSHAFEKAIDILLCINPLNIAQGERVYPSEKTDKNILQLSVLSINSKEENKNA